VPIEYDCAGNSNIDGWRNAGGKYMYNWKTEKGDTGKFLITLLINDVPHRQIIISIGK
jgi:hypothetical protein